MTQGATLDTIQSRKAVLIVLVATSALVPALFIQYHEPTAGLMVIKALAKIGSLVGMVLLVWQFILGFRLVSTLFHKDLLWLVGLHKFLGTAAILLILLHPVGITIYYARKFDRAVLAIDVTEPFYRYVLLGIIALTLLLFIFITSVFLRTQLGYGRWFVTHLATYLVAPLAFIHAFPIGMTLRETPLRWIWAVLAAVASAVIAARLLNLVGWRTRAHRVVAVRRLTRDVTELSMQPLTRPMEPDVGQFVYVRRRKAGSQRPYTVARYDNDSGLMQIAAKAGGRFSTELQHVGSAEQIHLDGPYGVFSQEALHTDRPIVMVAGGIGITAFMRLVEYCERTPSRSAYLFYGNQTADEIAYRDELDKLTHVTLVHVISDQQDYSGEKGLITVALIAKYVREPIGECEVLICGPAEMTEQLERKLLQAGVPDEQIHYELFGF